MPALKYWDGSAWQDVGGGPPEVFVGTDAPTPRDSRVLWVDTDAAPAVTAGGMDAWHLPGTTGEAALGTGWKSAGYNGNASTSVEASPGTLVPFGYRKQPDGRVVFKGIAQQINTMTATTYSTIFTLPAAYCPPKQIYAFVQVSAANLTAMIRISPSGAVEAYPPSALGANNYFQFDGVEFDTETVALTPTVGITTIPLVSALPGSPYDGQEIYYLADATLGVIWHLRYRAASASQYKWEAIGAPAPLVAASSAQDNLPSPAQNVWYAGGTVVRIIPPLVGDYIVTTSGFVYYYAGGPTAVAVILAPYATTPIAAGGSVASGPTADDGITWYQATAASSGYPIAVLTRPDRRLTVATLGYAIQLFASTNGTGLSVGRGNAQVSVRPARVG